MGRAVYMSIGLALLAVSFLAGARWTQVQGRSTARDRAARFHACPMHPQYRSAHPGDCPTCGMRLVPVPDEEEGAAAVHPAGGAVLPAGAVRVTPERQQIIGVRLGVVEQASGRRTLRTTGRVTPDENAVYPLVAGADGLVRGVRGATTGSLVKRNEVLLTFFAAEFVNAQLSYFSGLDTLRVANQDALERFANSLRNLGVSEGQLARIRTDRRLDQYIDVVSPVDGFVLDRKASAGLRCDRGFEFYRIADLRRVWILADVYENQAPFIQPGAKALITSQQQGRRLDATVSRAEPVFDEATRTLKVRLVADNPGLALKPGMFVDVEFELELPPSMVVPSEAIVDSGLRKTVFVDRGEGTFEPRQVETGWRLSDQVEITRGLMVGERIVISGTFLMDSESRMKTASRDGPGQQVIDPVCGMAVDAKQAARAGRASEYRGVTHHFCADECKRRFDAAPDRYARTR